jgi:hypothetical protein
VKPILLGLTAIMTSLAFPDRRLFRVERNPRVTLPDFITRASLELRRVSTRCVVYRRLISPLLDAVGIFLRLLRRHCKSPRVPGEILSLAIAVRWMKNES